jgi:hypothetical protein
MVSAVPGIGEFIVDDVDEVAGCMRYLGELDEW